MQDSNGSLIDPVHVFQSVWSARRLIILTTIFGLLLGVAFALSMPKKYTAYSQIFADPRDIKVVQNEVTPNGLPTEATLALIESQIAVINSNDMMAKIVESADLTSDPEFNGQGESLLPSLESLGLTSPTTASTNERFLQTMENLREVTGVSRDAKSFILNISVTTESPEKSARLSRLVANTFIDHLAEVQSDTAGRATNALSSRLAELREKVSAAERAVEDYKSEKELVGVGGQLVDDSYILRINDELSRGRANVTALRVKAEQMSRASVDDVVEGAFPEELTSDALTRLRATYSDLAQKTASLAATLGPRHPQLIASRQSLASARDAIRSELARIVAGAQTDLARAERTNSDLTRQLDELKSDQVATSGSFVRLRELQREVEASRAVYESYLLRARETGEQQGINTANVRVISEATPPLRPSSLSRRLVVGAGGMLGFLAGVFLAGVGAISEQYRNAMRMRAEMAARPRPSGFSTSYGSAATGRFGNGGGYATAIVLAPGEGAMTAGTQTKDDDFRPSVHASAQDQRRMAEAMPVAEAPVSDEADPAPVEIAASEDRPVPANDAEDAAVPTQNASDADSAGEDETLPPAARRRTLRERIRALGGDLPDPADSETPQAGDDEEVVRLQNDIAAVKKHIADIRGRRQAL
ncbi:GumC family protein [Aurantimonas coralicida]|uniref:GumC family protein n=1 Tax=Aurantimonas coralicida TaxID=182270 RepID=UPI00238CDBF8|nr:GNVR domain-containing protein [Aurantimonas coralicida]MDE0924178.1 Wzz/FepE/Etk N-terminal domain-containing protein [Aurantimonas coralicida]